MLKAAMSILVCILTSSALANTVRQGDELNLVDKGLCMITAINSGTYNALNDRGRIIKLTQDDVDKCHDIRRRAPTGSSEVKGHVQPIQTAEAIEIIAQ